MEKHDTLLVSGMLDVRCHLISMHFGVAVLNGHMYNTVCLMATQPAEFEFEGFAYSCLVLPCISQVTFLSASVHHLYITYTSTVRQLYTVGGSASVTSRTISTCCQPLAVEGILKDVCCRKPATDPD